jgi:hypothetical protein
MPSTSRHGIRRDAAERAADCRRNAERLLRCAERQRAAARAVSAYDWAGKSDAIRRCIRDAQQSRRMAAAFAAQAERWAKTAELEMHATAPGR